MGLRPGFATSLLANVDGPSLADIDLLPQASLDGRRHGAHGGGDWGGGRLQSQSTILAGTCQDLVKDALHLSELDPVDWPGVASAALQQQTFCAGVGR